MSALTAAGVVRLVSGGRVWARRSPRRRPRWPRVFGLVALVGLRGAPRRTRDRAPRARPDPPRRAGAAARRRAAHWPALGPGLALLTVPSLAVRLRHRRPCWRVVALGCRRRRTRRDRRDVAAAGAAHPRLGRRCWCTRSPALAVDLERLRDRARGGCGSASAARCSSSSRRATSGACASCARRSSAVTSLR